MSINKQQILQWFTLSHQHLSEQRDYLTELDTAIGDGDHGLNMQRGFSKVLEKLPTVADKDLGTIFKTVGMTLLSNVGGASGPIYGTFFMKGAVTVADKESLTTSELIAFFEAGLAGVIARGKAEAQDKTLCDLWQPLLKEMGDKHDLPATEWLQQAVPFAKKFAEATAPMLAKKGRASYLGERSVGHIDPGAMSSYYLLLALAESVR